VQQAADQNRGLRLFETKRSRNLSGFLDRENEPDASIDKAPIMRMALAMAKGRSQKARRKTARITL
jgi:hypothetical protein